MKARDHRAKDTGLNSRKWYGVLASLGVVYALMLYFTALTPPIADDYGYGLGVPFSLWQVLAAEWTQYFQWGGRSVAHVIVRCLLHAPWWVHVLLNPLVFCGVVAVGLRLIHGAQWRARAEAWHVWVLFGLIWLGSPRFGEAFLWVTGTGVYLWPLLFGLSFLVFFRDWLENDGLNPSLWGIAALGLLAGWGNEGVSSVCLAAVSMCCLWQGWKLRRLPLWAVVGWLCCLAGWLLLVLAPGNALRMLQDGKEYLDASWAQRVRAGLRSVITPLGAQWPLALAAVLALICKAKQPVDWSRLSIAVALIVMAALNLGIFLVTPATPLRAHTSFNIFLSLGVSGLLFVLCPRPHGRVLCVGLLLGGLLLLGSVGKQIWVFYQNDQVYSARVAVLTSSQKDVVLPRFSYKSPYYVLSEPMMDVRPVSEHWISNAVALYNGKNSVRQDMGTVVEDSIQMGEHNFSVKRYDSYAVVTLEKGSPEGWTVGMHFAPTVNNALEVLRAGLRQWGLRGGGKTSWTQAEMQRYFVPSPVYPGAKVESGVWRFKLWNDDVNNVFFVELHHPDFGMLIRQVGTGVSRATAPSLP